MMPRLASGRALGPALLALVALVALVAILATSCGGKAHPQQPSCVEACRAEGGPCARATGADQPQCLAWCERSCGGDPPPQPPAAALDPRCSDRTATGRFDCTIYAPAVTRRDTAYPEIAFAPGDVVDIRADGCVQRGGDGASWRRYVNPAGLRADQLYHGLIRIPTATPAGDDLVRIQTVLGRLQSVTGAGAQLSDLVLHLGYEDDHYQDNGYTDHDDGSDQQCRLGGASDGGPAHVTVTICRGVPCVPSESRYDFDVVSYEPYLHGLPYDPNGLIYNPTWSWQRRPQNQGQIPNTSLCHELSERVTILGIPLPSIVPSFADCTDQLDPGSVDVPEGINSLVCWLGKGGPFASGSFVGHVNWFPVTLEGHAFKADHSNVPPFGDADFTFAYTFYNGNPLSVNTRPGLHIELDSAETIQQFQHEEWKSWRKAVEDGDLAENIKRFSGYSIATGMFSMDGEHSLKAELHPLFALSTRRDAFENDPADDVWLMFARNRGDEGYCSSRLWDAGFEDYTVRLPWLEGATAVDVSWSKTSFEGTDGTSGPNVEVLPPPAPDAGVYVTFHLGPAAQSPFVDGALHLSWTGAPAIAPRPAPAPPPDGEGGDEAEEILRKAGEQLTPAQRQEIARAQAAVPVPQRATHRLPPGTLRRITAAPEARRPASVHAIDAGPATEKAARDQALVRALCAATGNAPPSLPDAICQVLTTP